MENNIVHQLTMLYLEKSDEKMSAELLVTRYKQISERISKSFMADNQGQDQTFEQPGDDYIY
ncbi:hypothetical protein D1872_199470 [compost metagenome]